MERKPRLPRARYDSSSLRKQRRITTGFSCRAKAVEQRLSTRATRRMGPGPRRDDDVFLVIARSEATKQSTLRLLHSRHQWIALRSLSSGAHSRDPLARDDARKAHLCGPESEMSRSARKTLP